MTSGVGFSFRGALPPEPPGVFLGIGLPGH